MKREAINHSKMRRLSRRLDVPLYHAVGLIEILLKLTEREAPRGDVGKLSDEDIAVALDYRGDEHALIEALVISGWLDRHPDYRLLMHGWSEHAEDAVHMRLARAKQFFADGRAPKFGRLPNQERAEAQKFYDSCAQTAEPCSLRAHGVDTNGPSVRGPSPIPSPIPIPKPSPSPTPLPSAAPAKNPPAGMQVLSALEAKLHEVARAIHERHPPVRRCGLREVDKALVAITKRAPAADRLTLLDTIDENHREWCASEQWTKDGGEFAKGLDNWLAPTKDRYLTRPEQAGGSTRVMTKSERSLAQASQIFEAMNGGRR